MTTIEVTQEDIDHGAPYVSIACPIALALDRILPGTGFWRVAGYRAENEDGGRIVLPEEAFEFQGKFDVIGPSAVKPFSFEIQL
jgi:hypothetical protein